MSRGALYALTLHRPWAALLAHGFKQIENREWSQEALLRPGQWIAIHAGKTFDDDGVAFARARGVPDAFLDSAEIRVEAAFVGVARYDGFLRQTTDPWFVGPIGWMFGAAVAIEPVPCRGFQKLWTVPIAEAELVRERYREARVAARRIDAERLTCSCYHPHGECLTCGCPLLSEAPREEPARV